MAASQQLVCFLTPYEQDGRGQDPNADLYDSCYAASILLYLTPVRQDARGGILMLITYQRPRMAALQQLFHSIWITIGC